MIINYIEKDGQKLFSFHRHDYKRFETGEFIDGGFDYTRSNAEIKSGEIKELIEDIRLQFTLPWGKFPIGMLTMFLIRKYFKYYLNKGSLGEHEPFVFEILNAELLYRHDQKRRKVKTV